MEYNDENNLMWSEINKINTILPEGQAKKMKMNLIDRMSLKEEVPQTG
jgi:hypothetical protein